MSEHTTQTARTTLVLEIELPTFYADDLRADDPDWQRWLRDTGTDPEDAAAVGQEILGNIGEVYHGLLTIEVSGEKDSEIIRTPVLMVGARAEDRPPEPDEKWKTALDHFEEKVDEEANEARMMARCDAALVKAYEPFVRWAARLAEASDHDAQDEAFKQIVAKAVEAMEKARAAEEEAEHA